MQRKTKQREAIIRVFEESDRPLTVEEVQKRAATSTPTIGIATVYRAVKEMLSEGSIHQVTFNGDFVFYERADLPHHHHFFCRECNLLFDLQGCASGVASLAPASFHVTSHDITLYGVCPDCNQSHR